MQCSDKIIGIFEYFFTSNPTASTRKEFLSVLAKISSQVDINTDINEGLLKLHGFPNVIQQISNGKSNQTHIFFIHSL